MSPFCLKLTMLMIKMLCIRLGSISISEASLLWALEQ